MSTKNRICIIPGSFDPFTLGHLDIVKRASKLFDTVYVAVMVNSEKTGMFGYAERKVIAEASCGDLPNVKVITYSGMLCDLTEALGAEAIIKGVRNMTDYDYEATLAEVNRKLAPDVETVILISKPEYSYLCSAFVRELFKYERSLNGVMHPEAIKAINLITAKESNDRQ